MSKDTMTLAGRAPRLLFFQGAAFFGLYVWHGVLIYVLVHGLGGLSGSIANRQRACLFLPLTAFVFCGFYSSPYWVASSPE